MGKVEIEAFGPPEDVKKLIAYIEKDGKFEWIRAHRYVSRRTGQPVMEADLQFNSEVDDTNDFRSNPNWGYYELLEVTRQIQYQVEAAIKFMEKTENRDVTTDELLKKPFAEIDCLVGAVNELLPFELENGATELENLLEDE